MKPLTMSYDLVFSISRILGLCFHSGNGRFSSHLAFRSMIPLTCCAVSNSTILILCLMHDTSARSSGGKMMRALWICQRVLDIVCLIYHAIGNVRHRIKLTEIFKALKPINSFSDRSIDLHLTIITLFAVGIGYLTYSGHRTSRELLEMVCHIIPSYASLLIVLQFCSICSRFSNRLSNLAEDIRTRGVVDYLGHANLVELAEEAIRIYGVQLLINCETTFCTIVSSAYSCYSYGIRGKAPIMQIILLLMFIALRFISTFFLTRASERIRADADRFNLELFNIMREKKELCDNEIMAIYVSVRPSVTVTACKFFVIGHPLLTSINAAASTYLVILIQFSSSTE